MTGTLRLALIGLSALAVASCDAQDPAPPAKRAAADPLIGKWVNIADNGAGALGTIADFRKDGSVTFKHNGKTKTLRYKREPGKFWVERRAAALGMEGARGFLNEYRKPGVELVTFAGRDGKFVDYGGSLLTLDAHRRVLYNIITQIWCRPGEEARVRKELRMK